jgi:hypothetical protein
MNHPSNVPVHQDHFRIGGDSRSYLGLTDTIFDLVQEAAVKNQIRIHAHFFFLP